MYKKIIANLLVVFGLFALWVSTSITSMDYISQKRKGDKWWSSYQCKNGNLVGMAYLDFVKKFLPVPEMRDMRPKIKNQDSNIVLFLYGDSYSWPLTIKDFEGISAYHFTNRYQGGYYKTDRTKRNILIIEIAERLVRDYFSNDNMITEFHDSSVNMASSLQLSVTPLPGSSFTFFKLSNFFNKRINQNLEFNLFNYNFITSVFKFKAAINYYLFNRASGNITFSNDRKYLFEKGSVNLNDSSSSYIPIVSDQISFLVANINKIYDHYKAAGFYEVYLSIIPSTPSIVQPEGYNNLIPMIQDHSGLRMKIIDIYSLLNVMNEEYFCTGDTHWSSMGEQKWLDAVNKTLSEAAVSSEK